MIRPWKLLRIILWAALAWFLLVLLWAFLPSPTSEHDGDNGSDYATTALLSGRTLTRVYSSSFHISGNQREAFSLDYRLSTHLLTLSISCLSTPIPLLKHAALDFGDGDITQQLVVQARTGDVDGANLPWFRHADAALLYWWIHKETVDIPLTARWYTDGDYRLDIAIAGSEPLLSLRVVPGVDGQMITAAVPPIPRSSSPSRTYPIRVAIIRLLGPTGKLVGSILEFLGGYIGSAFIILWVFLIYGFLIAAVVISIMRCVGGSSLEDIVQATHDRLEKWKDVERLRFLPLEAVRNGVSWAYHNERLKAVVNICREGWHPERDRERRLLDEAADLEKAGCDQ